MNGDIRQKIADAAVDQWTPSRTQGDAVAAPAGSVLLYSKKHTKGEVVWWGPNERGYTRCVNRAGRYTMEQALKIAKDCNWGAVPVREEDLGKLTTTCLVDLGWGNNAYILERLLADAQNDKLTDAPR